ncbi:MAG: SDR family NAD(P)-dependent oxidoreductase [Caldilineaceae bacterium]
MTHSTREQQLLNSLQQSALIIQNLETQLAGYAEPIAVIGMACRYPGAVTPEAFWQLLVNGVDRMRPIPADRWDGDAYYDPTPGTPGKMYVREGAFLDQVDHFDAHFFGISPREAASLDPQQRLLLEVCWETLERAGQAPAQLRESQTGVFVGLMNHDYSLLEGALAQTHTYAATGNINCFASGRLSYVLGLRGPNMVIDTACSSSLVTIHLACRSLRQRECKLALAGGVNLMLLPEATVTLAQMQALAPDGRCKTFDAAADGFNRGEGCGMLLLKRLSDAVADQDPILAVIRGSAVNHDGPSSGLTVPSKDAQAALIRTALQDGNVASHEVAYVDAHGTGTVLGDPIELRALDAVFNTGQRTTPLWVGSVKTNIGHLESAAGVAGVMKVILAMQHGAIPPHLHFHTPNPNLDWTRLALAVPTAVTPWPADRRFGGVSSFGMGGTNAHLVLEKAPQPALQTPATTPTAARPWHILALSARDETARRALAARYVTYLADEPATPLAALCDTANRGRNHFAHRVSFIADTRATLSAQLAAYVAGENPTHVYQGQRLENQTEPKVALLFTGQGSQYINMGRELYELQPTFCATLDRCDEILRKYLDESILAVIFDNQMTGWQDDRMSQSSGHPVILSQTMYTQPALFALEYALATLWQSWGIQPRVVMGHSVGEIVAACIAGVFSLEDGLKLVTARGRLMQALPQNGAMVAISVTNEPPVDELVESTAPSLEAQIQQLIAPYAGQVSIAAINSPHNIVIAGHRDTIDQIVAQFQTETIAERAVIVNQKSKVVNLQVSHAFHSPLMEPMLADFAQVANTITYHAPKVTLISNLTGRVAGAEVATPAYWVRHVREPVRFAAGMNILLDLAMEILLEVGPKPTLLGLATAIAANRPQPTAISYLPSLRANHSAWRQMMETLGQLYAQGAAIDWQVFTRPYAQPKLVLPTYPFQRRRYWVDGAQRQRRNPALRPLIDRKLRSPIYQATIFESAFSTATLPFLQDHRIYGQVVAPAAAHVALLLNGMDLAWQQQHCQVAEIVFPQPLVLPMTTNDSGAERIVQLIFTPMADSTTVATDFQIVSFQSDDTDHTAARHATGRLQSAPAPTLQPVDLDQWRQRCTVPVDITTFYADRAQQQVELGPNFRWVTALWQSAADQPTGEAIGKLTRPAEVDAPAGYLLPPGLLDGCFQVTALARATEPDEAVGKQETLLPFAIDAFHLYQAAQGSEWWCHARQVDTYTWDIDLFDQAGQPVLAVRGFTAQPATATTLQTQNTPTDWLYQVSWQPQPLAAPTTVSATAPKRWLIFGAAQGIGAALATHLRAQGQQVLLVTPGLQSDKLRLNGHTPATTALDPTALDPTDAAAFHQLLADYAQTQGAPCDEIVYLWGVEGALVHLTAIPELTLAINTAALYVVQALAALRWQPRLWLVTQGCQIVKTDSPLPSPPLVREGTLPPPSWGRLGGGSNLAPAWSGSKSDSLGLLAAQRALWAWGRTVSQEAPEFYCTCLDLEALPEAELEHQAKLLLAEIQGAERDERQIAYRQGARHVARLARWQPSTAVTELTSIAVRLTDYGALDYLTLQAHPRRRPAAGEVEIEVKAAGLNFRDVLNALGLLKDYYAERLGIQHAADLPLGFEYAGEVVAVGAGVTGVTVGDAVMGLATGSLASYLTLPAAAVVPLPTGLDFAAAATLPLAFLTAWYGLKELANLQPGERVLIHAAAGGVGQAAVQIAQVLGAEVLGTAHPDKWAFLQAAGVQQPLNSRTLNFADQVKAMTNDQGVQVVLNSLTADFIPHSLLTLAPQGRFVEMGKLGIWSAAQVAAQRPDVAYHPFDLGEAMTQDATLLPRLWRELLPLFAAGKLKPLPHTIFPVARVTEAFRLMQRGKHKGKIVVALSSPPTPPIQPTASYLITGGCGALGLQVAQQLAAAGARHLILAGRHGLQTTAAKEAVAKLQADGVTVAVVQADVARRGDVARLLAACNEQAPLRGIVHAAGVLDDALLPQQTAAHLRTVMQPKVWGAWWLHRVLQEDFSTVTLDFFVAFSSAASLLGATGQANYAAANGFLDGLMAQRRAIGLPGLSINWGPWAGEAGLPGMAATLGERFQAQGYGLINAEQGSALFDLLRQQPADQIAAQISVLPLQWPRFAARSIPATDQAFYSAFTADATPPPTHDIERLHTQLTTASPRERYQTLLHCIQQEVVKNMHLHQPPAPHQGFMELGIDSLMAVELRNRLQAQLDLALSPTVLFKYATAHDLATFLAEQFATVAVDAVAEETEQLVQGAGDDNEVNWDDLDQMDVDETDVDAVATALAQQLAIEWDA